MDNLNEEDIQYFPLDFDALQKGDSISPEHLEKLTEKTRGTDAYNLAVLALRERIIRECKDREKHFTVAVVKGHLRILTDEEAAVYNMRTFRAAFRRQHRSLRMMANTVNTAALSDTQKKEHERNLIVCGKMLQAARSARAQIAATPHQRTTPGLPEPKKE